MSIPGLAIYCLGIDPRIKSSAAFALVLGFDDGALADKGLFKIIQKDVMRHFLKDFLFSDFKHV